MCVLKTTNLHGVFDQSKLLVVIHAIARQAIALQQQKDGIRKCSVASEICDKESNT